MKKDGLFINADKISVDNNREHNILFNEQIKAFDVFEKLGFTELKQEWIDHYVVDNSKELRLKESLYKSILDKIGFSYLRTKYRNKLEAIIVAFK